MIVAGKLLIEVKVSPEIDRFHMAQVLHYLKASDLEVGPAVQLRSRTQVQARRP